MLAPRSNDPSSSVSAPRGASGAQSEARSGDRNGGSDGASGRPSRARRLVWVYLALLLLSHGWRLAQGRFADPEPSPAHRFIEVEELAVDDGETVATGRTARLAYLEWPAAPGQAAPGEAALGPAAPRGGPGADSPPTVLLVHGSPGDASNFTGLAPRLAAEGFRVLAPDLPGFGASSQQIADYSIRAHAAYCQALLEELGLGPVHAVGFSLGGGVVLELWDASPSSVESLVLLAAVGVQELELLGQYGINHAIHGAQLVALWLVQEGFPHFGLLDRSHEHLSYAHNFFDTDQRPLRGVLERFDLPMLILHGEHDVLVPVTAAREHERIVPQSELVTYDANHFLVFRNPAALVAPVADFVRRVEAGQARTRATATAERRRAATEGEPLQLPQATGPTLVVWFLLLVVATFVSEDLTCIAAGLLVARGSLGFAPAALACGTGILLGDMGLYLVGRVGRPFLDRAPLRWWLKPADLARSARWFERRGGWVILLSRFLPGTRIATYVSAGLLGMSPLRFFLYLLVPVALWTPLLVYLAVFLGERFFATFEVFQSYALPAFAGLMVGVWILVALGRSLATWGGRRRWVGGWKRRRHWEFWPPWAFYPPVVAYLAWLALRHRSATLFTAANPGIPAGGGFVGESKSQILDRIGDRRVAEWQGLPAATSDDDLATRRALVTAFVERQGGLPVVLKPDVGERGTGVVVAREEAQVETFLESCSGPAIVQRYVPGPELGVFWIRLPGEETGRVFSITDKRLPEVVGDGESSLERLVLADPRAVAMASTYLERLGDRRDEVPAAGERVRLVELGTHCRGAVFLDGEAVRTPELEAAVDAIARSFEGFYFGRFDLRAPSYDHFRRGEGIRVLELNGVTSEATHIYDRKNSLLDAYRVLFEQWRLAFEIGRRNRERGHRPSTLAELVQMTLEFRRRRGFARTAGQSAADAAK